MNPDTNPQEITSSNPLQAMQAGEQNICEIKRHPIGIFYVYFGVGLLIAVIAYVALVILPTLAGGQMTIWGYLILLVMSVLGVAFAFFTQIIYWGNRWIITSDSITQIEQTGLFAKQSSQLSLENIEDVSSIKNGIMAHIFNYGSLKAQTAGEHGKFMITYCPNPDSYARQILNAREQFLAKESSQHQSAPSA